MYKNKTIIEVLGWYGAAAIVGAYFLASFKILESDALLYQLLNFTGALGVIAISLSRGARQPAVLNMFWALIALVAIFTIITK